MKQIRNGLPVLIFAMLALSTAARAQVWEVQHADKLLFSSSGTTETKTITLISAALATGGWTYTLPDAGASATFALTTGAGAATIFTGPTASRTYTLPDANATILTSNAAVTLAQGGTGAALTADNGGIFYSTASAAAILAHTTTAGQILRSGASAAPTWSSATYPSSAALGDIMIGSATNVFSSLAGNTTTTNKFLTQAGTGSASASPAWLDLFGGTNNWTGTQSLKFGNLTTNFTNGLLLIDTTASTAGVPVQQSPSLLFRSHVWNTTATAADSTIDARLTLVPVSGAATTPLTNSALQFTFGNTSTTNTKSLTMTSRKLSTADSEMIMEETGDQYGTTRLRIQNRNGSNGPLFEMAGQTGIDLCDFGFKPNAGVQSNLRLEARTSTIRNTANDAFGEFQFYMNTTSQNAGTATYNFSTGEGATAIEVGNVGIGMVNPTQKLEVMGGNLLLATTSANADSLEFQGPTGNTGITTFAAGAQGSTNINYLLPTTAPTVNQILAATSVSAPAVTLGWSTPLTNPMNTLGDLISGGASGALTRLAGQTTIARAFLSQTESGGTAAAPGWFDLFATANTWSANQTHSADIIFSTGSNRNIDFSAAASGTGNTLAIAGNQGAATSAGGPITITGGAGGGTSGNGGALTLNGGAVTSGTVGPVSINDANAGAVSIAATSGTGAVAIGNTTGAMTLKGSTIGLTTANASNATFTLGTSGIVIFSSSTANSDDIAIKPQSTVNTNAFQGTITSADLTAARTWTLPDATGNVSLTTSAGTALFTGPTSSLTFTLPNAAATILTNNAAVTVAQGGTGQSSAITQGGVIYSSSTTAMGSTGAGSTGQVLTSAGTGTPTWGNTILTGSVTSSGTAPSIPSRVSTAIATITVTGAVAGDAVMIGMPVAAFTTATAFTYNASVTASNTVTVYAFNAGTSSVTWLSSQVIKAVVIH